MLMADAVSQLAARTPGKEAVAMEAYAKALRQVTDYTWPRNHTVVLLYPVNKVWGYIVIPLSVHIPCKCIS